MLTPRQHECWRFLASYTRAHGYSPSFEEIAEAMGLASKSNVHRLLQALEQRGFIRRMPGLQRAIEIIRTPDAPKEKT
ncbi:LexA family protein [Roseovarius sp. SYSU LYC5161]|jgi:repressor LexA|uniref:LexA family protein n=1 Tax=Roseovarius halophilus (ex Wu et al. 2025) TaxID=3376060 RepID=UPI00399A3792